MEISEIRSHILSFLNYDDLILVSKVDNLFHQLSKYWFKKKFCERFNFFIFVPEFVDFINRFDDLFQYVEKNFNFFNSHATTVNKLIFILKNFFSDEIIKDSILNIFMNYCIRNWAFYSNGKKQLIFEIYEKILKKSPNPPDELPNRFIFMKSITSSNSFVFSQEDSRYKAYFIIHNSLKFNIPRCEKLFKRCLKYDISPDEFRERLLIIKNFRSLKKHSIKQFIILGQPQLKLIQKLAEKVRDWMVTPDHWRWAKFLPFEEFKSRLMLISNAEILVLFGPCLKFWIRDPTTYEAQKRAGHFLLIESHINKPLINELKNLPKLKKQQKMIKFFKRDFSFLS